MRSGRVDLTRAERAWYLARSSAKGPAMAIEYLKRAAKSPGSEAGHARDVAERMLAKIEREGEAAVREYAATLDRWTGPIVVARDEIERRIASIERSVRDDIDFATERVQRFATAQRESIREFSVEVQPGLVAGQRLIPVNVAGCYVPCSSARKRRSRSATRRRDRTTYFQPEGLRATRAACRCTSSSRR